MPCGWHDHAGNAFNFATLSAPPVIINGDTRANILTGTAGADNIDQIRDFYVLNDTVQLENTGIFSAPTRLGALSADAFTIGAAATQVTQRIIYNSSNGHLFYDADVTGVLARQDFMAI